MPYGLGIDTDRLLKCLTTAYEYNESDDTLSVAIGIHEKGRTSAEAMAFARYAMFASVYWHHTSRALKVMMNFAVRSALPRGPIWPDSREEKPDTMAEQPTKDVLSTPWAKFQRELAEFAFGPAQAEKQLPLLTAESDIHGSDQINSFDRMILLWFRGKSPLVGRKMIDAILSRQLYKRVFTLGAQEDANIFNKLLNLEASRLDRKRQHLQNFVKEKIGAEVDLNRLDDMPLLLLDVPTKREPEQPLFYLEERTGQAVRLRTSVVWRELHEGFLTAVSRVRVFAHPAFAEAIAERVERGILKEQLVD